MKTRRDVSYLKRKEDTVGQKQFDKNKQPERTPQEDMLIQPILAQYRQIAQDINRSSNEEQTEAALAPIIDLPEASQIALLKALAKEKITAAADVVLAMNTYAPVKAVRKEARRALIRLEGSNVYPEWELPTLMSLSEAVGVDVFAGLDEAEDEILDGENVVELFLGFWSEGEYESAYDLLATTSPLRDNLARDEWVARRNVWAAEAQPARPRVDVGYGLEPELEEADDELDESAEDLDAFWSLEMLDVASSSGIPELPTATLTYPVTGRHWFWAGYTFIQEDDGLRIYSIRDKGAEALQLPVDELHQRIQEIADEISAMSEELEDEEVEKDDEGVEENEQDELDEVEEDEDEDELDEDDLDKLEAMDMEELTWFTKQAMHYCDALIAQAPQDEAAYALASQQAMIVLELERAIAYFSLVAERFPELRGDVLRTIGMVATDLANGEEEDVDEEDEDDEIVEQTLTADSRFIAIAEKAFRDAIDTDNSNVSNYLLLADLFIEQNRIEDARTIFEQAQALATNPEDLAAIEVGRARLARLQDTPEVALAHFQRAAELAPNIPGLWYNIGDLQLSLEQNAAAEKSLLKSVQIDPTTTEAYADLATLYMEQDKENAALKILEQGVTENPFSVELMAEQSMIYIHKGNIRRAEELIEEAEEIEPEAEIVVVIRQVIELQKEQQRQQQRSQQRSSSNKKSKKSKKRR